MKIYQYLRRHVKKYAEGYALQHCLLFEIYTTEVYEIFVYKHTEKIEYVKSSLLFKKNTNFTGK